MRHLVASPFLLETDAFAHVAALQSAGAPRLFIHSDLLLALAVWQPEPDVWGQPALVASQAVDAVQAAKVGSLNQQWFASISVEDQLGLVYASRNAVSIEVKGNHQPIEAFLLHAAVARETVARCEPLTWPAPQLSRLAWASQRTPLQEAVSRCNQPVFIPYLLAAGEDARARDAQGATALHWVAASPRNDEGPCYTTRELVEVGADVHATDARGRTAMDIAMGRHNWLAVRELMNGGARPTEEQWPRIERRAVRDTWEEWGTWKSRRAAENLERTLSSLAAGNSPCERRRL